MKKNATRGTTRSDSPSSMGDAEEIHFYRANEKPYGAFSNLFRREILFEDEVYATAEHA